MKLTTSNKKTNAALLSIISNTSLIALKILAGVISGSVSIISEAIHSSIDLVASFIAYFSVRMSSKPADREHPYGHGKIENFSGLIEGVLIFIAALIIIKEAIGKMINPSQVGETWLGITIMFISAITNLIVSKNLYKVAKEEDSMALEADALHLKTDVYTSVGVGVGLIVLEVTKLAILDSLIAIAVALLIIKEACTLCVEAFKPLIDTKLSDEEEDKICTVMRKYNDQIIDYHDLCTRKSGNMKYVEFHMTVDKMLSVQKSHEISENIEKDLEETLKNTYVLIHIEPGDKEGKYL
ncbi:MAG: cation transporter [Clostridiales bacterium GWE2_32_10]|nr:MAG: cation transporter [Clostridiales bacterium GWE2_32_10]HBY19773.1 cation transporter [Clostridiales bacterium]